MKIGKILGLAVVLLIVSLVLGGCFGGGSPIGYWQLDRIDGPDGRMEGEDLRRNVRVGFPSFEFTSDTDVRIRNFGVESRRGTGGNWAEIGSDDWATYRVEGNRIIISDEYEDVVLTRRRNTITMSENGITLRFQRIR